MSVRRLFTLLFAIALFTMAVRETLDPDMWWHLRTGELILESGIPTHDLFSFTVPEHEWVTHEWLSQAFMWVVYDVAGLSGLIIIFAFLIAVTFWLLYLSCEGRPYLAAFVVLLSAIASAIVWGARPQIFNLLLTAVFLFIIERWRKGEISTKALWWLPVLTILWANLHSGYLLGIVLIGTYAVGEAAQRWWLPDNERSLGWPAVRQLFLVAFVSFIAAVLNPSGVELWIYPFLTLGSPAMQAYIQEWHSPDFHLSYFWPFVVMMGLGVISWIYSAEKPTFSDYLLFFGTAATGLISARNIPIFSLIATPVIARHLLSALSNTAVYPTLIGEQTDTSSPNRTMVIINWVVLLIAIFGAFIWTANTLIVNEEEIALIYPVTAVDYLHESGLAEQHGYNSYNWGGYLIWRDVPVFVDGRADVYGDDFLFYYRRAFELQPNWQEPLDSYDVDYVIMEHNSPLSTVLSDSSSWQEVYADDLARIFIRD